MLRYDRQTKPGLVALYDIRPRNAAGPFLQPRSPHWAKVGVKYLLYEVRSISSGSSVMLTSNRSCTSFSTMASAPSDTKVMASPFVPNRPARATCQPHHQQTATKQLYSQLVSWCLTALSAQTGYIVP